MSASKPTVVSSMKSWQVTLECERCKAWFDKRVYDDPSNKRYYSFCAQCNVVISFGTAATPTPSDKQLLPHEIYEAGKLAGRDFTPVGAEIVEAARKNERALKNLTIIQEKIHKICDEEGIYRTCLELRVNQLRKRKQEAEGALKLALNHILSIPSNGFHFHIKEEGDAFKQLRDNFISKSKEEGE
jgi:hypothetical protein